VQRTVVKAPEQLAGLCFVELGIAPERGAGEEGNQCDTERSTERATSEICY